MDKDKEIEYSFKGGLTIVKNTLSGKGVPFKIKEFKKNDDVGIIAKVIIGDELFVIAPNEHANKLWIVNFPISNADETGIPSGYIGFPTEVAGVIDKYYREKPDGPFQRLAGIGTINLNEVVREEIQKVMREEEYEDYNFAEEERENYDREDVQRLEAEVSSALSFMQDVRNSDNNLRGQKGLGTTNEVVDSHIDKALSHISEAMMEYLKNMSPEAKSEMSDRMGEININK